jgi:hypothetical protein
VSREADIYKYACLYSHAVVFLSIISDLCSFSLTRNGLRTHARVVTLCLSGCSRYVGKIPRGNFGQSTFTLQNNNFCSGPLQQERNEEIRKGSATPKARKKRAIFVLASRRGNCSSLSLLSSILFILHTRSGYAMQRWLDEVHEVCASTTMRDYVR